LGYYGSGGYGYGWVVIQSPRKRRMDLREVIDLIISWAVLTIAFGASSLLRGSLVGLAVAGAAVATAFIAHELSHRQVARRYGLYAKYRAWYAGLALALAIALFTTKFLGRTFVFAAPGAVYIMALYPTSNPKAETRIAEAGPLANIAVAIITLIVSTALPFPWRYYALAIGSVNAWIALFNLLPIPPLDGFKVLRGAPGEWAALFAVALALYFFT